MAKHLRGGGPSSWSPQPVPRYVREGNSLAWGPPGSPGWGPEPWDQTPAPGDSGPTGIWKVLNRRRKTIALVFAVTLLAGGIWTLTTRPVYTATVTLRIDKEEPRVLHFEDVVKSTDPLPDSLQTHQRLLQSRALANRVIKLLSLQDHPDFRDGPDGSWMDQARTLVREQLAGWLPEQPTPTAAGARDLAVESPLTRAFQNRLAVEAVRGSRLAKVSFESHDPTLAARVANALSDTYVAQTLEFRADTGRYASGFLNKQMGEARGRLENAEHKLNEFLKVHGINFVAAAATSQQAGRVPDRQDLITQQLGVLSDSLLKARSDRIGKESLVAQAKARDVEALPAVLQSPLIVKLKGDLGTLEAEYKQLGQTFKADYPRMRQIQQSIGELRAQVRAEVERIAKGLETDYQAALQNERQIDKAMEEHRTQALRLGDRMVEYNILRRDVDASRDLYTSLLTRLKETQVSTDLLTSPISVVDRAEVPLRPARPRRTMNLLLASVIGLLGGVGLAFVLEHFDRRIKSVDEVERVLGVPRLGLVPQGSALGPGSSRRRAGRHLGGWSGRRLRFALVTHLESSSLSAESFRELGTSILYSMPAEPPRTVMVTSLEAGEGKTSLAANLAVALAQLGSREVLLLDGNLRRPELHKVLDVPRTPGLSAFLEGHAELPAVLTETEIPNLYLVPAGRRPENPGELLASRRLDQALEVLSERFDHIIVDGPPLFGFSDTLHLAPRLDGVVLVLRHGRANREDAQEAVQRLSMVRANLLGVVVNGVGGDVVSRWRGKYGTDHDDDDGTDDR
jgi:succinoglycan biosynthesis transport protein ExoP